jgi:hypothetical protein
MIYSNIKVSKYDQTLSASLEEWIEIFTELACGNMVEIAKPDGNHILLSCDPNSIKKSDIGSGIFSVPTLAFSLQSSQKEVKE